MGMYQTVNVCLGLLVDKEILENMPITIDGDNSWTVGEYLREATDCPVEYFAEDGWDKAIIGITSNNELLPTNNRLIQPGFVEVPELPRDIAVSKLQELGFTKPSPRLYIVVTW